MNDPPDDPAVAAAAEHRLLHAILRGEAPPGDAAVDAGSAARLLALCRAEDVMALVHHQLRRNPGWDAWPEAVREPLAHAARMQAAVDMLRERELIAVLAALAAAGIDCLLLKGTPLAYSHYPEPALRSRCDTDVLIAPTDRAAAAQVLAAMGYAHPNAVSGSLVSYEQAWCKRERNVDHVVDLHWQINNGQVFARALGYAEARERSVALPRLGASARTLCPPHALLLACMHRAAHLGVDGPAAERLLWLYDIHLIGGAMSDDEWAEFARICDARSMREISLDAFDRVARAFGTAFPVDVLARLRADPTAELSARYLRASRRRLLLTDLRALPNWTERAVLMREMLFPPADYLLAKYGAHSRWLLPWWYLRRAAEGVLKSRG